MRPIKKEHILCCFVRIRKAINCNSSTHQIYALLRLEQTTHAKTYTPGLIGEVEASTRMDGLEVAADRTVVAASATAAALGRMPLAPVDRRGRPCCCCCEAEHTSAVIFDLWGA